MPKDHNSVSGSLTDDQKRTLIALLDLIIPPSEDGKMPGAADVGFFAYMQSQDHIRWIKEGLLRVVEEARKEYGKEFSALSGSEQMQLIEKLRRTLFRFLGKLTTELIQCYYQNDHVLEAIGLEARPPFPQGYTIDDGDLTLLEPVYERGKLYRD